MTNNDIGATLRVYNRTVTQSQLFTTSWNAFASVIKTYPNPKSDSSKWFFSSRPFNIEETKDNFPRLILSEVDIGSETEVNFDVKRYPLTISFYVEDTSSEKCDILSDGILDHIMINLNTLYGTGIRNPRPIKTNKDYYDSGSFVIHERRIDILFDFFIRGFKGV